MSPIVTPFDIEKFLEVQVDFKYSPVLYVLQFAHYFAHKPVTALVKGVARGYRGAICLPKRFIKFCIWLNSLVIAKKVYKQSERNPESSCESSCSVGVVFESVRVRHRILEDERSRQC